MDTIPKIVLLNPYRVLGVYANSSRRDIVASKGKATAFLKVGQKVEYPLDLRGILPPITRTLESISEAEARIAISKEQIKYIQFWFLQKMSPLDDEAFNHLFAGDMAGAIDVWSKQDSLSSLQNRLVCFLIENNLELAVRTAEKLYGRYGNEYIDKFDTNGTLQMTGTELLHQFLDSLGEEIGIQKLLDYKFEPNTINYISRQVIGLLVDIIYAEIESTKKINHKDPNARKKAGQKLMVTTNKPLRQLKSLLSINDPQYVMIADKLGLEILQCGIDYFNNSENDDESPHVAMKIQKYAQSVVVGTLAKQRCDDNIKTLDSIIKKLPPLEVILNHKTIQSYLISFTLQPNLISNSIQLIKDCVPHVIAIKEKIGRTHPYYLKISTTIVHHALNNVIAEVNEAQNKDFNTLKKALISAWRTQLYMDKFDLEPEYKEGRYKENREVLHGIISECKGFDDSRLSFMYQYGCGWCNDLDTSDVDLHTDEEYYQSCCDLASYRLYLEKFPSGNYVLEAKTKIIELRFEDCKTITDYKEFIHDYPDSIFALRAEDAIKELILKEKIRKERIARQEKSISACKTLSEVLALYNSEKTNSIDLNKCSLKAYDLAQNENDYQIVVSTFGARSAGGKKAKASLDEIEKKRKKAKERRSKTIKWSLIIIIPLLVLLGVYLIWGLSGLSSTCYVFTFIFGFIALGGIGSKEGEGCVIGIISGLIAFGLGSLGGYLGDLSKEEKKQNTEYVSSYSNESTNNYSESDYPSRSTTDDTNDESYTVDNDYETYIDNQLKTGSKPYKDYYRSRTGGNYLDFKTSGNDYVIIVKDYGTSDVVNHIYIRAGDTGRLYLPNGTYNIYFYGGKGWNPDMENGNVKGGFVSGGHIQKDGPVELYNQYGEYTLYPVQNGNLQLQGASKGEAF